MKNELELIAFVVLRAFGLVLIAFGISLIMGCGDNATPVMLDAASTVDALPWCGDVAPLCDPPLLKPCGDGGCSCDPDGRSGPEMPVRCEWPSCASLGCEWTPTTIDRACAQNGHCSCDGERCRNEVAP